MQNRKACEQSRTRSDSAASSQSKALADRSRLRHVKAVLLAIAICTILVGRNVFFWPLISWPMYSNWRTPFPDNVASVVEVRVIDRSGTGRRLRAHELLSFERGLSVTKLIQSAFLSPESDLRDAERAYLTRLIRYAIPKSDL